jgi:hypothetical protein
MQLLPRQLTSLSVVVSEVSLQQIVIGRTDPGHVKVSVPGIAMTTATVIVTTSGTTVSSQVVVIKSVVARAVVAGRAATTRVIIVAVVTAAMSTSVTTPVLIVMIAVGTGLIHGTVAHHRSGLISALRRQRRNLLRVLMKSDR